MRLFFNLFFLRCIFFLLVEYVSRREITRVANSGYTRPNTMMIMLWLGYPQLMSMTNFAN